MNKKVLFMAALLAGAFAAYGASQEASMETLKAGDPLAAAAADIPVKVSGKTDIRCQARLRWQSGGYRNRCPYGQVMTGVELSDGQASLSCGELEVTCSQ